jgi:hypothetical protein
MSDDTRDPAAEAQQEYILRLRLETDRINMETMRLQAKACRARARWDLHWWGRWAFPLTFIPGVLCIFMAIVLIFCLTPNHPKKIDVTVTQEPAK